MVSLCFDWVHSTYHSDGFCFSKECRSKTSINMYLIFRVEDHDDLMPIFSRQSPQSVVLSDNYGDYYLAELIDSQDENMKCIVAEVDICIRIFCSKLACILLEEQTTVHNY